MIKFGDKNVDENPCSCVIDGNTPNIDNDGKRLIGRYWCRDCFRSTQNTINVMDNNSGGGPNSIWGIITFFTLITLLIIFILIHRPDRQLTDDDYDYDYMNIYNDDDDDVHDDGNKLIYQFRQDINFHFRAFQAMDT